MESGFDWVLYSDNSLSGDKMKWFYIAILYVVLLKWVAAFSFLIGAGELPMKMFFPCVVAAAFYITGVIMIFKEK